MSPASADDTLEMAALLGVKFKKSADGQFAHSNVITILNPEGEIIHQQIGLGQNLIPAVKAIEVGYSQRSDSNCKDDKRATNLKKRS